MDWLTNYFAPLWGSVTIAEIILFIILIGMTMGSFSLKGWKRYVLFSVGIIAILLYSHITIESARVQETNIAALKNIESRIDEQNKISQVPSVILVDRNDRFEIHNKGLSNVYFLGYKIDGNSQFATCEPTVIAPGSYMYDIIGGAREEVHAYFDMSGSRYLPYFMCIKNESQKEYLLEYRMQRDLNNDKIHVKHVGISEQQCSN